MLNELTRYLLQYKKVAIPHVGTLEIVQKPAEIKFTEKLLLPPNYHTEVRKEVTVSEHQLDYLALATRSEKQQVDRQLDLLGKTLQKKISSDGFLWHGIGHITGSGNKFSFISEALQPVPAEKVPGNYAQHKILVGDQHFTSEQMPEMLSGPDLKSKRSVAVIMGWILLIIAIAFIIYILYRSGFSIYSAGLKSAP